MRGQLQIIDADPVRVDGAVSRPEPTAAAERGGVDVSAIVRCPKLFRDCLLGLLEATPGLVIVSSRSGRLLYMNTTGRRILGVDSRDLSTRTVADLYTPYAHKFLAEHAIPRCLEHRVWRGETTLVTRDGREIPVSQVLMAHAVERPGKGDTTVFSSIAWDLREHKRTEEELRHQATHDALTGLPNRGLLLDRLTQALHAAQRHGNFIAVLFIDLNDFKRINDEFGHGTGDRVLRLLGTRLKRRLRAEDTVARYGGDEFVVLVPDLLVPQNFERVQHQIEQELSEPFIVDGRRFRLSASIGVAICPSDGDNAETLLKKADSMMYRVKRVAKRAALNGHVRVREDFVANASSVIAHRL